MSDESLKELYNQGFFNGSPYTTDPDEEDIEEE